MPPMIRAVVIVFLTFGFAGTAFAANKCVGPDGQVTFQDTPCSRTATSSEQFRLRENTVSNGVGRAAAPEKLEFGSDKSQNAVLAAAALELLATNARDCRIELKVRPNSNEAIESCNRYLAQRGQWWLPATQELGKLIAEPGWWEANRETSRRGSSAAGQVKEAHAFIALHLRSQ